MSYIFSGNSGGGKTEITKEILKDRKFMYIKSLTTRLTRSSGEENYEFTDRADFERRIARNELAEFAFVHDEFYGTLFEYLNIPSDKIGIKSIDVLGTAKLKKLVPDMSTIFITVSSIDTLRDRIKTRGEVVDNIELRLGRFAMENSLADSYDYIVSNDAELTDAVDIVKAITSVVDSGSIFAIKGTEAFSQKKVASYIYQLCKDIPVEPVSIEIRNGQQYVIKGRHRYLASVATGKHIAKRVLATSAEKISDQQTWLDRVKYYTSTNPAQLFK